MAGGGPALTLLVTLAVQVLVAMAALSLPVAAPVIATALGFPVAQTGNFMALMFACSMLATLSAGTLVGRYGAIRVSQVALLLCAAGLVLCTLPSKGFFALGVLLIGLGYGPVTPASSHLLAMTTPAHRMAVVFSIKQTGVPLGAMLAGAVVPGLLLVAGWQAALLAVAAAALLCAASAVPLRARLDADRDGRRPLRFASFAHPLKVVLSQPPLRRLAVLSLLFCGVQQCLATYLVAYLHTGLGYTLVAAGFALSLAQACGAAGRVVWGHAADTRVRPRTMLVTLGVLMALGSIGLASVTPGTPPWALHALLVLFGASAIGWNGVYLAEVARHAPAGMASAATAGALVFTYAGMVLGPATFALVLGWSDSYRLAWGLLAIPALLCALALFHAAHGEAGMRGR